MCDDHTQADTDRALAARGLSRRDFAASVAAMGLAACSTPRHDGSSPPRLVETMVEVPMASGTADAFFVHPAHGRHPGVVFWPDIAGLRNAKKLMARRLAAEGFAVLVVNQYYRSTRAPVVQTFAEWLVPENRARTAPMAALLTPEAVASDGAAYAAFLDRQPAVDPARGIGTQGYCMGGPFAVRTAAASQRIRAAASFHGGGLVTPAENSPHLLMAKSKAAYLIAIARNDDERNPAEKDTLRSAAQAAHVDAEVEVYPADHGWCVPDSPSWNQAEADRAFARLLALYSRL